MQEGLEKSKVRIEMKGPGLDPSVKIFIGGHEVEIFIWSDWDGVDSISVLVDNEWAFDEVLPGDEVLKWEK